MRAIPAAAFALALATPAFGADEGPANRLLVESAKFAESADRASSGAQRRDLLRRARTRLQQIVAGFPDHPIAAKLATGQAIGNLSLDRIDQGLASTEPCEGARDGYPTRDCSLAKAETAGSMAAELKASGTMLIERNFDREKSWQLEAELAVADAIGGEFPSALKRLGVLEKQLPINERRGLWPRSLAYFDALGPVACELARAGYGAESRALLREGALHAREMHSPGPRLRRIAVAQACAAHFGDAVDTATSIRVAARSSLSDDEAEAMFVRTIAGIAETAMDDGAVDRAAKILEENFAGAFPPGADRVAGWPESRSALVLALAKLGRARSREGDGRAATAAFERALDTAGDGKRDWPEIGKAAIRNRNSFVPTAGPTRRARDAVADLVTIATAMHAAGMPEKEAARTLADAERAAGGETGPLAEIAAARFRIGDEKLAERTLALAEEWAALQSIALAEVVAASPAMALAWWTWMGEPGPRCSHDHEWFERTKAFDLLAEHVGLQLPTCATGLAFTERVNLAAAYLAKGDHGGLKDTLSCGSPLRTLPAEMKLRPFMDFTHPSLPHTMGSAPRMAADQFPALCAAKDVLSADPDEWVASVHQWHALGQGLPATEFGIVDPASSWFAVPGKTSEPVDVCWKIVGQSCAVVYPGWWTGTDPWTGSPYVDYGMFRKRGVTLIGLGNGWLAPASWGLTRFAPDYDHPDALRAELARKLARGNDFESAVDIASGIASPNRRSASYTELAALQLGHGLMRDARATLVRAVSAAMEIPEGFPDARASFWIESPVAGTIQDRAIRFARIAQVLGRLLPHE